MERISTLACAGSAPTSVAKSTPTRRVRADRSLNVCCSVPGSSRKTLFSSASIFSQKASAARKVHHGDLPKGHMIDLHRQRELHSLQNHGLCRGVPRRLFL